jgi:hypothetical protein
MALVLSLFGLGAAIVVIVSRDVLFSGTIALMYLSVMLVSTLLAQHGATMLSTADYTILGVRPVSSRTFFAIRLTNVLFHTLLLTSLMSYPVVLAYAAAHGVDARRAVGATIAIYAWAIVIALALVAAYAVLMSVSGMARLQRTVGYLQMLAAFLTYGGLLFSSRLFGRDAFASAVMPDTWWVVLIPSSWFASYLELSVGVTNSTTLIRATLSVLSLVALAAVMGGRLGLEYARHLAELASAGTTHESRVTRTPLFRRAEARAVAILVIAHFRHDLRVRMGILAIVPLMVLYVAMGTRDGTLDLVAIAVLLFPALLSQHFAATDAYQGAWIYRASPVDPGRLVIALKNVAIAYFLLPFLLFVAIVFTWRLGDVWRAVVHTTMLGLISHLALQGSIVISPRLPFALPPDKTRGSASLVGWMLVVILGGQAAIVALDRWVYVTAPRTLLALAVLLLASWGLNRAIDWRAHRLA